MSKIIATNAINGAAGIVSMADKLLKETLEAKSGATQIIFPDTAYYMPMILCLTGRKVQTVEEILPVMDLVKSLVHPLPNDNLWFPYLGHALDAGIATMLAEEIYTGLKYYLDGMEDPYANTPYEGFLSDTILRELGIQLVDGRMPGFAAILGKAESADRAVKIVRDFQKRSILTFLSAEQESGGVLQQLQEKGVDIGWEHYIVPLGPDTISTIYALNWAARGALTFGGIAGGDYRRILKYTKDRVFAFALVLGPLTDIIWATGAGAINMGFPAIADSEIPEVHPSGVTTYEAVVKQLDQDKLVDTCIEVRGVKVDVSNVPVPVPYGAAFEGERIRKEDTFLEFGGTRSPAFEWLRMKDMSEVEDNKTTIVGPDLDNLDGYRLSPLGILVEVAGRKMQKDFEPVLERKIHDYLNCAQGFWHMGQRNQNWMRISKTGYEAGLRIKHIGDIIHAKLLSEFPAIVDKVQVTLYTDEAKVKGIISEAATVYKERDDRVAGMTDESVDVFYSCTLCQSFAPDHACMITPERLGLCGAYSWLDGKAAYEINPNGPNQLVVKNDTLDAVKGQWSGVNEAIKKLSHDSLDVFNAYSLMENPMTSCGCFECIIAIMPEANGVMVVHRGYAGMTPSGMKFSTLAGTVGGGVQNPGFMGVGSKYIASRKFISAEGGLKRLVWMPKDLKEQLREELQERASEAGIADLLDRIATEENGTESEEVLAFLTEKEHPALTMESIL